MKKLFGFVMALLLVLSCADEIEFNTPTMNGRKDGGSWKAAKYRGYFNASGKAIISGSNNYDVINLQVPSFSVGTYLLGESSTKEAVLIDYKGQTYSTNNLPDEGEELYPPDGIIEITNYNQEKNTISGKFWFNAYSTLGTKLVSFNHGVFYEIPIPASLELDILPCDYVSANTDIVAAIFNATSTTDSTYQTVCEAYKDALRKQQIVCGDDLGILQEMISSLNCN